eukprot:TRINITY_DN3836_c0_g1_i1.p1 TRINITY_DN3836_c0_g1~~TRINITY_DN3836_c0_g1_i1.p1  ORF type:complete len:606 (+),score=97.86 TRINITY_DN3836_c0_g1_i1:61-1878(+)
MLLLSEASVGIIIASCYSPVVIITVIVFLRNTTNLLSCRKEYEEIVDKSPSHASHSIRIQDRDLRGLSSLFCFLLFLQASLRILFFLVPSLTNLVPADPTMNEVFDTFPGLLFFSVVTALILQWIRTFDAPDPGYFFRRTRLCFVLWNGFQYCGQFVLFYFLDDEGKHSQAVQIAINFHFAVIILAFILFPLVFQFKMRTAKEQSLYGMKNAGIAFILFVVFTTFRVAILSYTSIAFKETMSLRNLPHNERTNLAVMMLAYYILGEVIPSLLLLEIQYFYPRSRMEYHEGTALLGRRMRPIVSVDSRDSLTGVNINEALYNSLSISCIIEEDDIKKGDVLGRGGNGVVYKGQFRGTPVALKESFWVQSSFEADQQDFLHEIALLSKLRHPYIVQFYGVVKIHRKIHLVTELCDTNLSILLQTSKPSAVVKMEILKQIALAMSHLHRHDPPILHRDIKPENILLTSSLTVKLADFGLARMMEERQSHQSMTFAGTPNYSPPEVIKKKHFSTKSDVFGFGVIMWEVFTQRRPYPESFSPFEIMDFLSKGLRPHVPNGCPRYYERIMEACWNQDPACRPEFIEIVNLLEQKSEPYVLKKRVKAITSDL